MWMVRYDEGTDPKDAEERFIAYGSALRCEGNTYFSSLSKLFVIQHNDNEVLDVKIEGQSHINLMLGNLKRPKKLFVNGKQTQVKYEKGGLNIRMFGK